MDLRIAKLNETVHLGYGDNGFDNVFLRGLGKKYDARLRFAGTVLTSSVFNSPAFAIQGARGTKIQDFSLHGTGKTAVTDLFATNSLGNRSLLDVATWQNALATAGLAVDRENAPIGGIVVDPYGGPVPADGYPAVNYPAFMGSPSQYNKLESSEVTISNVEIQGFEVGVVVQPNSDANGDFVQGTQMDISFGTYAFSIGNTQARGTSWNRTRVSRVHTLVTNNKHGAKAGHFDGFWYDIDLFGFVTQLFDLGEGWTGGTLTFQNLYAESIARIGTLTGQANIPSTPVVMRDCRLEMNTGATDQFVCGPMIEGTWRDRIVIENCNFRVPSVLALGNGAADLRDNFLFTEVPQKPYQALASNCLSGGFAPDPLQNPEFTARLSVYSATAPSSNFQPTKTGLNFQLTGRDNCIPHALTAARHPGRGAFSAKQMPVGYAEQARQIGISRTDRTIELTNTHHTLGDSDRAYRLGMLPGCVWMHRPSSTVLFVRSVDTATGLTHLEMQNNYYFDGTNWQILDTTFDPQTAEYYTFNGLVYAPEFALFGDATSGSNVITNVNDIFGSAVSADYGLTVGDRIADGYYPVPLAFGTNRLEITDIDTSAQTITLNGPLSYTGRIPLPFWYRQPPANESSR